MDSMLFIFCERVSSYEYMSVLRARGQGLINYTHTTTSEGTESTLTTTCLVCVCVCCVALSLSLWAEGSVGAHTGHTRARTP